MFEIVALLLAQAAASAVPPSVPKLSVDQAVRLAMDGRKKEKETARALKGLGDAEVEALLAKSLTDKTKLIYQAGHGVYVEYTAPDGQLRMWYPKNQRVVLGAWGLRRIGKAVRACFKYSDAINPVTQVYEPTECVAPVQTISDANTLKAWDGDVFHLMGGAIPYPKGNLDMPEPELLAAN